MASPKSVSKGQQFYYPQDMADANRMLTKRSSKDLLRKIWKGLGDRR